MNDAFPFIAGTASPRRLKLLDALGIRYTVCATDAPEIHHDLDPVHTVAENAAAKHAACARLYPDAWILTADTVVVHNGRCLGKPASPADAHAMLLSFSDASQTVLTGMMLSKPGGKPALRIAASGVTFRPLTPTLVAEYLAKAHTHDRAGAYDIDTFGDMIVADHTGSYANIMGLPVEILCDWLLANGFPL